MREVALGAGQKIVEAHHRVAFRQQPVAHMGADETGGPGYDNSQSVDLPRSSHCSEHVACPLTDVSLIR